jgi:hypothetical protein
MEKAIANAEVHTPARSAFRVPNISLLPLLPTDLPLDATLGTATYGIQEVHQ